MSRLSILILAVASIAMIFNLAYIVYSLGWFARRDRRSWKTPTPPVDSAPPKRASQPKRARRATDSATALALRRRKGQVTTGASRLSTSSPSLSGIRPSL
jgi:hypothetical protein